MSFIYDAPIPYNAEQPYDFSGAWGNTGVPPIILPHLNAVLTLQGDGTFAFWQQGTIDEVAQSVEVICGTTQGDRTVVTTFGLPPLAFTIQSNQQVQQTVELAVNTWEPRAAVQIAIANNGQGSDPTITVNTSLRQGSTV